MWTNFFRLHKAIMCILALAGRRASHPISGGADNSKGRDKPGSRTVKVLPLPNSVATRMVPPWASTMAFVIAKPRPVWPAAWNGFCQSGRNARRCAGGLPRRCPGQYPERKERLAGLRCHSNMHDTAGAVMVDGVADEVADDLYEFPGVAFAPRGVKSSSKLIFFSSARGRRSSTASLAARSKSQGSQVVTSSPESSRASFSRDSMS